MRIGLLAIVLAAASVPAALAGAHSRPSPPNPVPARPHSAFRYCPSPSGLEQFTRSARASARRDALDYLRVSLAVDLSHSERSWVAETRAFWKDITHPAASPQTVYATDAAKDSGYAVIVRHACGASLLRRSLAVTLAPVLPAGCQACRTTYFLVDRRARPLIYFVYP